MVVSSFIPSLSPPLTWALAGAISGALAFMAFALALALARRRSRGLGRPPLAAPTRDETRDSALGPSPDDGGDRELDTSAFAPTAVTVSRIIIISEARPQDLKTPHPLAIIPRPSAAMAAGLPEDDCPTEIRETFFDVPPKRFESARRPRVRPATPPPPRSPC